MADITKIGDDNANLTEMEVMQSQEQQDNTQAENQELANAENPDSVEQEQVVKTDWEKSAKHFQSEKDKMFAENQQLKAQLQEIAKAQQETQAKKEVEAIQPPESFDPWEAYNDPNSESYAYRQQMEQHNINQAVARSQQQLEEKMTSEKRMQEFDNELVQQGLSAEDKESFYAFANKPLSQLGTDKLVAMWRAVDGQLNTPQNASGPREFAKIRANQAEPTPAGVLQGEQPPVTNQDDATWDRIMNATNRSRNIL